MTEQLTFAFYSVLGLLLMHTIEPFLDEYCMRRIILFRRTCDDEFRCFFHTWLYE